MQSTGVSCFRCFIVLLNYRHDYIILQMLLSTFFKLEFVAVVWRIIPSWSEHSASARYPRWHHRTAIARCTLASVRPETTRQATPLLRPLPHPQRPRQPLDFWSHFPWRGQLHPSYYWYKYLITFSVPLP